MWAVTSWTDIKHQPPSEVDLMGADLSKLEVSMAGREKRSCSVTASSSAMIYKILLMVTRSAFVRICHPNGWNKST